MASFDPSVISQIPDMAGNPAQAKAQAYKLSDLIDEGKLRKLQLAGAQQEQKRDADIRSLLSGAKLDTPEDRMKVAGEMSRIDPSKGMQFMRETSQEQLTQLETKKLQMDFVADTIGPAAEGVLETLDTKGPAMAAAQYQQHVPEVNRKLKELGINQQLPPQLDFSNPQTRNLLQQQIAGSKTARQMRQEQLAQNRDVRQEEAGARAEKSGERQERRLELAEKKQGPTAPAGVQDKRGAVYASMSDRGISFPSGMRAVKAQQATIDGLLKAHPNDTPEQIADRLREGALGLSASKTEAGVVARREGSAAAAINSLNRQGGLYDQVMETAKKVDFGSAKFANSMRLWKQGKAIADPDIAEYVNALADTRAEFASVLARGGQVTDSVRIAAEHAFPDSLSLKELDRAVSRSKKVAESIQAGNTAVLDAITSGKNMDEALRASSAPAGGKGGIKPYDDAEKERRYQEWKKAHGGG